jgi:hypothetical protein
MTGLLEESNAYVRNRNGLSIAHVAFDGTGP